MEWGEAEAMVLERLARADLYELLKKEKRRRGASTGDLVFIGIANVAELYWCPMKSLIESVAAEPVIFGAYLEDRILYALILWYVRELPVSEDELLLVGDEVTFDDVEKLLKEVRPKRAQIREIGASDLSSLNLRSLHPKLKDRLRGKVCEEVFAEKYPTIRWNFSWEDYVIVGAPDGVTDEFVYEFKCTRSSSLLPQIRQVAFAQGDLYGYFFRRIKKRVQIHVIGEERTRTWYTKVNEVNAVYTLKKFRETDETRRFSSPERRKCESCEFREQCSKLWTKAAKFEGEYEDLLNIPLVGNPRREVLRRMGISKVEDLLSHPLQELKNMLKLEALKDRDVQKILPESQLELIYNYAKAFRDRQPLVAGEIPHELSRIFRDPSVTFLDLEYDAARPFIFIIGTLTLSGERKQWFSESEEQEREMLAEFAGMGENKVYVTYAGRAADEPILRKRLQELGIPFPRNCKIVELLYDIIESRKLGKQWIYLPSKSRTLENIAEFFGFARNPNVEIRSGFDALLCFEKYLRSENEEERKHLRQQLLLYNEEHLKMLKHVFDALRSLGARALHESKAA
ncbi:MAG: ribonuclease H-like domain-containing protein [Thermofilaceae archaeon]